MSGINYVNDIRSNPGNEKAARCEICGAVLVCLSCGNHRAAAFEDKYNALWRQLRRLIAAVNAKDWDEATRIANAGAPGTGEATMSGTKPVKKPGTLENGTPVPEDLRELRNGPYAICTFGDNGQVEVTPWISLETLIERIARAETREKRLRDALERLRDCDWVISLPDRMDAVREVARAALSDK